MKSRPRAALAAIAASALMLTLPLAANQAPPAQAAVPPTPTLSLTAAECLGTTSAAPELELSPTMLDDYNAGRIVPLYDAFGYGPSDPDAFPPLCGVRYLSEAEGGPSGGGPVSAWMFCTHIDRGVCLDGRALDIDDDQNNDLSDFQRNVIAYLVQNGHDYQNIPGSGGGTYPWGGPEMFAQADAGSTSRVHLQYLIWCVSDYAGADPGGDFRSFCEANELDPTSIDARFGFLDAPALTPQLEIVGSSSYTVGIDEEAVITLRTTIVNTPLQIALSEGSLRLCTPSAAAMLSGSTLTLHTDPSEPATSVDVQLCISSDASAVLTVEATGIPTHTESLHWYHNGDEDCQVFAAFNFLENDALSAHAEITVSAEAAELGGFTVTKALSLEGDAEVDPGAVFEVGYVCDDESGTLTLLPGTPQTVAGIPVGTECLLTETTPAAPTEGSWQIPVWSPDDVQSWSYTVLIDAGSIVTPIAITLSNTATTAELLSFSVLKRFEGDADARTLALAQRYGFSYHCSAPGGAVLEDSFTLAIDEQETITGLSAESECLVTEDAPPAPAAGYRWLAAGIEVLGGTGFSSPDARNAQFTMPATGGVLVTAQFTNRLERAALSSTGADPALGIIAGAALLFGGGLLMLMLRRRRLG